MSEQPERRAGRGQSGAERALVAAVRRAMLPTLCLPFAFGSLGASATGAGLPFGLAWPGALVAVLITFGCWHAVLLRWRSQPRRDEDDGGGGWRRGRGGTPHEPSGGPDGVTFDWTAFERQFWSHVLEHQQRAEREPVTVS